jgi:hypothetical protein
VASTTSAEPAKSNAQPAVASASDVARAVDGIQTVGFYTKVGSGFNSVSYNPTPIVLFKSGEALYDMGALLFPGGLAAHKAAHPKDWTKWRRAGKAIEVIGDKGWEAISSPTTMDRLPSGLKLAGYYVMQSFAGGAGGGYYFSHTVWRELTLDEAGNFSTGGGNALAGSNDGLGRQRSSVTTINRLPGQHGRYTIDGYILTLNYADGHVERRTIVTDLKFLQVIWLDGDSYLDWNRR